MKLALIWNLSILKAFAMIISKITEYDENFLHENEHFQNFACVFDENFGAGRAGEFVNIQEMACRFCSRRENREEGEKFKQCSACKLVYYCSPKCQKKDWKMRHKMECKRCI